MTKYRVRGKTRLEENLNARIIFKFHNYTCVYCGNVFPMTKLTREHIFAGSERTKLPKAKRCRQKGDWRHIVPACRPCNMNRGSIPHSPEFRKYLLKISNEAADYRNRVVSRIIIFKLNKQRRKNGYLPIPRNECKVHYTLI